MLIIELKLANMREREREREREGGGGVGRRGARERVALKNQRWTIKE